MDGFRVSVRTLTCAGAVWKCLESDHDHRARPCKCLSLWRMIVPLSMTPSDIHSKRQRGDRMASEAKQKTHKTLAHKHTWARVCTCARSISAQLVGKFKFCLRCLLCFFAFSQCPSFGVVFRAFVGRLCRRRASYCEHEKIEHDFGCSTCSRQQLPLSNASERTSCTRLRKFTFNATRTMMVATMEVLFSSF